MMDEMGINERAAWVGIAGWRTIFPAYMKGLARFSHLARILDD